MPIALAGTAGAPAAGTPPASQSASTSEALADPKALADPLTERGIPVTGGAAPGYVPDRACAPCHADLYRSYQDVGMARSFYRPRRSTHIEDFDQPFFHSASERHYRIEARGDELVFRRYQLDDQGQPIHAYEQKIDWVLGSGNRSRTYLYQTKIGELYQLPVAWYTQTQSWGMAPGFDRSDHEGVRRRVRRECMFCHNGYPDVAEGSDAHSMDQVFPADLPEGTGCQRCHGPGAEHARLAMAETVDFEQLSTSIVNPSRLGPDLQRDVCYQCHLQPTVVLSGLRRYGRADYSYRPGEPLSDYLVQIDVAEDRPREERFEINHHPYRLEQSRCFEDSAGQLQCTTCHDPHRKVPEAERAAHYRAACQTCHQPDDCSQDSGMATAHGVDASDCVSCHMPQRRPQDVVLVTMTDHKIRRQPGGDDLLAALEEKHPTITDIALMYPETVEGAALREVYRALAAWRIGDSSEAIDHFVRHLAVASPAGLEPYLDLGRAQLQAKRNHRAEVTLAKVLESSPDHPQAAEWLALAKIGLGKNDEALAMMRATAEKLPNRPEIHFNLGRVLVAAGAPREALRHLERAVELRPNLAVGWLYLGRARAALDRGEEALAAYRRTLEIQPTDERAAFALGQLLLERGERDDAFRIWRHALRVAQRTGPIAEALQQAQAQGAVRVQARHRGIGRPCQPGKSPASSATPR